MARGPTQTQLFAELEARYGRTIGDAFATAIDQLKSDAEIQRATQAVADGNFTALMAALHVDQAVFSGLMDQIQSAYRAGGEAATNGLPKLKDDTGLKLIMRFNARSPRAEAWLREHSSTLVSRITDDQREAVRIALEAGLSRGDNPTQTALDIVGRIDRSTGKRVGGIIGLTSQQAQFVQNARAELASGDPKQLQAFLNRQLRDRRHDGQIARAARDGTPLPADVQARAIVAYEARLLKLRGETIARTETLTALRTAKHEAMLQALDKSGVADSKVIRTWRSAGDNQVRHTHEALNGQQVRGVQAPFVSPSGAKLLFPGDTSLGAGPDEIIGCRCDVDYNFDLSPPKQEGEGGGVTFEVAPDPNDAQATAAWNALTPERQRAISKLVAEDLSPQALQAAGAHGKLVFHTGGYLGATNPSMTLQVNEPEKVEEVARLLGHALSQDSMMVVSPTGTAHTEKLGLIDINIGDANPAEIYDRLWKSVTEDGKPIVTGHTTMRGRMSILNDSGLSDEEFARRISAALGDQYELTLRDGYVGFIGKDDYGFDEAAAEHQGRAGQAAAEGSSLREAADHLRSQAAEDIKELIAYGDNLPLPASEFQAARYGTLYDDPDVTPDKVLANFPPEAAENIADRMARVKSLTPTDETFKADNGFYADDREALHLKILFDGVTVTDPETGRKKFLPPIFSPEAIQAATPAPGEDPTFILLGGRGGSGKSQLEGLAYDPKKAIVLDADRIKSMLPEYKGWNAFQLHEESSDIFDMATQIAEERRLNLVHDATMKTGDKAAKLVDEFKRAGYRTEATYMFLPRQEAAKRAVSRFAKDDFSYTGRLVPPNVVLSNTTNEASFDTVKSKVDKWSFYDNNVPRGEPPKLVSYSDLDD